MTRPDFTLDDRAVYFPGADLLVLGDLHLGRTTRDHSKGTYPVPEYDGIERRLHALVDRHDPETVVLNGDVFHGFPFPDEGLDLLDDVAGRVSKLVVTWGNHEDKIPDFHEDLPESVIHCPSYMTDTEAGQDISVLHGHETPTGPADLFVIGHLHPVVPQASSKEPCYLYGENACYDTDVLILPAFSDLVGTVNVENPPSAAGHCPLVADGEPLTEYEILWP